MLWADGKSFYKKVIVTRLGENIASGSLSPDAMLRTAQVVCRFAAEGARRNAETFAFATAAVRSADNGAKFCALVRELCGLEVDVVSGEREAEIGMCGALGKGDGGIIDLGGASTEVCFRRGGAVDFRTSLPVGCVRLLNACGDDGQALRAEIRAAVGSLQASPVYPVYAVGGTAYLMACLFRGRGGYDESLQDTPLAQDWLEERAEALLGMSVEERKALPGMDASRADVSAGGAMLLSEIMKTLGIPAVRFSCRDNLEGYLAERRLV